MHEHVLMAVASFEIRPPARKLVLMMIALWADESGRGAWPSVETTVAPLAELGVRQTREHVAALRAEGYLRERGRRWVPGGREVVEWEIALSQEARQEWLRTHTGAPERIRLRTTNFKVNTTEVLRTSGPTTGRASSSQETLMPAPGFEPEPEPKAGKPRRKPQEPEDGSDGAVNVRVSADENPGPQKRAQRRGGPQGQLAAEFLRRQREVNPNLRANMAVCAAMFAAKLRDTGVSPEIVMRMIAAYWDDPRIRSNLRPTQYPHAHFLHVMWEKLRLEVERATTTVEYSSLSPEQAARNRRRLPVD